MEIHKYVSIIFFFSNVFHLKWNCNLLSQIITFSCLLIWSNFKWNSHNDKILFIKFDRREQNYSYFFILTAYLFLFCVWACEYFF